MITILIIILTIGKVYTIYVLANSMCLWKHERVGFNTFADKSLIVLRKKLMGNDICYDGVRVNRISGRNV